MNRRYVFCALALMMIASCDGDSQCEHRMKSLREVRDTELFVIDPGYLEGSEFVQLDLKAQQQYVDAVVDGMRLAPFFGAYDQTYPESRLRALLYCVASWGSERETVVQNYVHTHPEKLQGSAHLLVYAALLESCRTFIDKCRDTTCQGFSKL